MLNIFTKEIIYKWLKSIYIFNFDILFKIKIDYALIYFIIFMLKIYKKYSSS